LIERPKTLPEALEDKTKIWVNTAKYVWDEKQADFFDGVKTETQNLEDNLLIILAKCIDGGVTAILSFAIGAGIYLAYNEVKKGYRHFRPSIEEQLHREEVAKKISILTAEDKLYKCLVGHAYEKRNNQGLP